MSQLYITLQSYDQLPAGSLFQLVRASAHSTGIAQVRVPIPESRNFFSGLLLATKKLHLLLFIYFFFHRLRCMKFIIIRHFSYIYVLLIAKVRGNLVYKGLICTFS